MAVMYFRLLEGKHVDGKNRKYVKGDLVPAKTDLSKAFKNKFERFNPDAIQKAPVLPELEDEEEAEEETLPVEEEKVEADERGENVTKDFPLAVLNDLLVFKRPEGKTTKYFVYDHNELRSTKKGHKTTEDVNEFLNDITSE